jgi:hypothetical protein
MRRRSDIVVVTCGIAAGFVLLASPIYSQVPRMEGCTASFTCDACGTVEQECDDCTGWGYLSWTKSYTNCGGGTTYNNDCDDCTWNLSWGYTYCDVPDGEDVFDVDLDVATTGTKVQADCTCDSTGTSAGCHWDVTVHREWDAELLTGWQVDKVIRAVRSSPIEMHAVNDVITYTAGGSVTVETGWDFSFTSGVKADAVSAEIGSGYSYSTTQTTGFTGSTSHTVTAGDVSKYIGGFAVVTRRKVQVEVHHWGCAGEIGADAESGWARKADPAMADYYIGNTPSNVYAWELNTSLITGGTL